MNDRKILSLLGLAARGRNLVSGEYSTEQAVRSHRAKLVIVAADASAGTQKLFRDKCASFVVPLAVGPYDKEALGHAIGSAPRASIAVTDEGLARTLGDLMRV